ncbi:hypothetical protein [Bacillus sp. Brlt_9]|uniref:hypothetical protein n=1 Tax=Bacillus sp. Brlt_9 TaxID=3110916 RepID=UPI003F7B897E
MAEDKLNPLGIALLETPERLNHKFVLGSSGEGWGCVVLSGDTIAGLVNDGVKFIKNGKELVLTKEEIINEVKIGLRKGYFTKEDLFD